MEYLDIVNEHDTIVEPHVLYEDVHAAKAMHRAVHVLLFNEVDELLLQLRSEKKEAFPLHWTFSAGGHVRHGETYEEALVREVKEELDLTLSKDQFVYKGEGIFADESGHKVFYKTYTAVYDGPIEVKENDEVATVQFVSWETLRNMMQDDREKFQPEFVAVLKKHWEGFL